jgi:GNAT superfamily N-acetyltransferase
MTDMVDTEYLISTESAWLDLALIHHFLSEQSYWARGIPRDVVARSIANSLCFGVYASGKGMQNPARRQVGFARVATDRATFAYLADVFVLPEHRGQGLSKRLMEAVLAHPDLQGLRRWMLATADAHELYRQYGFTALSQPDRFMQLHNPDVYRDGETSSLGT